MIKNKTNQYLWIEKYRPQTLTECILPKRIINIIRPMIDSGEILNMLFSGASGNGKTTMARVLSNELKLDTLVINCSLNGNIDTLRTKISDFATSKSISNAGKLVIMDEADHLTQPTMASLRNFIEECSRNCRFIFTANYRTRIIEPLHSRLHELDFNLSNDELIDMREPILTRLGDILTDNDISYNDEDVISLYNKHCPDMRKLINVMQGASTTGSLDIKTVIKYDVSALDEMVQAIIASDFITSRQIIADNTGMGFGYFLKLRELLTPYMVKSSIPDSYLIFNDYDYRSSLVTDIELHISAMVVELIYELKYEN